MAIIKGKIAIRSINAIGENTYLILALVWDKWVYAFDSTQHHKRKQYSIQKIDKEIRKLIDEGYNTAKKILTEKVEDLHKIAKALMTYETLTGEEIENIINKNIYPADKQDLKVEDDKGSAMGALGLKPKIVH